MPFSIAGRDHDFCHVVVQPKQWQVVAIERFPLDRTIQGDESSFNFVDKFVNNLLRAVGVIPSHLPEHGPDPLFWGCAVLGVSPIGPGVFPLYFGSSPE
jgi:hypothetical protein